jgi:murein DD-endopeptidase MepM/ murein hydrolase activator NlpD
MNAAARTALWLVAVAGLSLGCAQASAKEESPVDAILREKGPSGGAKRAIRPTAKVQAPSSKGNPADHDRKGDLAEEEMEHVVRPGETLGGIALHAHVPRVLIIEANALPPPFEVKAGQKLIIPRTRRHTVREGETGLGIAAHYGVPYAEIVRATQIDANAPLRTGQVLLIPTLIKPAAESVPASSRPSRPANTPDRSAAVRSEAERSGAGASYASSPYPRSMYTGPASAGPASSGAATPPLTNADAPIRRRECSCSKAAPVSSQPARSYYRPASTTAAAMACKGGDGDVPEFASPVAGSQLRGYAPRGTPASHDGMDIAATEGAAVRASAAGRVKFAGREGSQFGNMVVIEHAGGWSTTYGFLSKVTVDKGETVRTGERIGLVGHTGAARSDALHFELRRDNKPLNPCAYVPSVAPLAKKADRPQDNRSSDARSPALRSNASRDASRDQENAPQDSRPKAKAINR